MGMSFTRRDRRQMYYMGGAFTPASISGLQFWVKADAITGLSDGEAVTTWEDQSGNGRDVTQATADKKPLYKTNIKNGLPVVRFDGINDAMQSSAFTAIAQPLTLIAVFNPSNISHVFQNLSTNGPVVYPASTDKINIFAGSILEGSVYGGGWAIAIGYFNGASSEIYVNTLDVVSGNAGSNTYGGVTLGAQFDAGSAYLDGDIAEAFFYNKQLTAQNITDVKNYLNNKYAIY